mgnify:CR=1 FL=1
MFKLILQLHAHEKKVPVALTMVVIPMLNVWALKLTKANW